jgi:hypothetical protein
MNKKTVIAVLALAIGVVYCIEVLASDKTPPKMSAPKA